MTREPWTSPTRVRGFVLVILALILVVLTGEGYTATPTGHWIGIGVAGMIIIIALLNI